MMLPLTDRQKSLYEYLLNKSTTTSEFITKEDICKDLSELYPRHEEKTIEHNSSVFHWIRNDVARINDELLNLGYTQPNIDRIISTVL